ncbi:uroporphyrinogen-III synthase [Marivita hallyeonensis]|uniref:uroporphyrinogen-III synthase n=1 Tax=Marivita hallyeonensis TaxID=996342 RepID=UPI001C49F266|nr:uroporphyrinogen-III synthase [Marivita hallyeonensis]
MTGPLPSLDEIAGLIFTSANALDAYRDLGGAPDKLAIVVGDGTASVAQEFGFDVDVAGGTADKLVSHVLEKGYKGPLMHLRGEVAIGDVAERLTRAGVTTGEAVLYEQRLEHFSETTKEALSQDRAIIAPVFSPRTARQLGAESEGIENMVFAAISNAVAEALPPEMAARTKVAKTPNRSGMVELVTQMITDAVALERHT